VSARFAPGDPVRVRDDWPEGLAAKTGAKVHIRTPHFLRGAQGTVETVLGAYPNPEDLAFGRPAEPKPLYQVKFAQRSLFQSAKGAAADTLVADLYEHWLEPVHG
jgi:nitrile hydratase subunit beta